MPPVGFKPTPPRELYEPTIWRGQGDLQWSRGFSPHEQSLYSRYIGLSQPQNVPNMLMWTQSSLHNKTRTGQDRTQIDSEAKKGKKVYWIAQRKKLKKKRRKNSDASGGYSNPHYLSN
jgi:hypothetical protein